MRFPAAPLCSPLLFFPFSLSRTGGPTGARDRFTRRDKCHRVRLGFPLCCSSAEGVMIKLHLETSLSTPPLPPRPLSHSTEGKRKWNSLIANPSLWTKRICIIPGAIESLHQTQNSPHHLTPPAQSPTPTQHPQLNFKVSSHSLSLSLTLSLTHVQSFLLFPRMPCRFLWLGTEPLCFSHYYHWADVNRECILKIIVLVINNKIDYLTSGRSFM